MLTLSVLEGNSNFGIDSKNDFSDTENEKNDEANANKRNRSANGSDIEKSPINKKIASQEYLISRIANLEKELLKISRENSRLRSTKYFESHQPNSTELSSNKKIQYGHNNKIQQKSETITTKNRFDILNVDENNQNESMTSQNTTSHQNIADNSISGILVTNKKSKSKVQSTVKLSTQPTISKNQSNAQPQPDQKSYEKTLKRKNQTPIIAYGINRKEFVLNAKKLLGHSEFSIKNINKNCTHIITTSLIDHKAIREFLDNEKEKFFFYTPKEDKPINLLIRGLDDTYDENDIINELNCSSIKLDIIKILRYSTLNSRRKNIKLNLWMIKLKAGSDIKSMFKLKYLLNQRVKIEKPQSTEMIQCKNCQRYGHAAFNCSLEYRCVKCNNNHKPGECTVRIESTSREDTNGETETEITSNVYCVNCKNYGHPASFRQCPAYRKIIKTKQENLQKIKTQNAFRNKSYSNYIKNQVSFSNVTKYQNNRNNTNTNIFSDTAFPKLHNEFLTPTNNFIGKNTQNNFGTNTDENSESFFTYINKECSNIFNLSFIQVINKLSEFIPYYKSLTNSNEKCEALISFMFKLLNVN